jgi:hypothetical protein
MAMLFLHSKLINKHKKNIIFSKPESANGDGAEGRRLLLKDDSRLDL